MFENVNVADEPVSGDVLSVAIEPYMSLAALHYAENKIRSAYTDINLARAYSIGDMYTHGGTKSRQLRYLNRRKSSTMEAVAEHNLRLAANMKMIIQLAITDSLKRI